MHPIEVQNHQGPCFVQSSFTYTCVSNIPSDLMRIKNILIFWLHWGLTNSHCGRQWLDGSNGHSMRVWLELTRVIDTLDQRPALMLK